MGRDWATRPHSRENSYHDEFLFPVLYTISIQRFRRVYMSRGCEAKVEVFYFRGYEERTRELKCGTSWETVNQYCDECMAKYREQFPQGWKHYAGDCCKHGTYVGGIGIDWLCGACENGDE